MVASDQRLDSLENDFKLLKGEMKRTLVELRAILMEGDSPLRDPSTAPPAEPTSEAPGPPPVSKPASPQVAAAVETDKQPGDEIVANSPQGASDQPVSTTQEELQSVKGELRAMKRAEALQEELLAVQAELESIKDGKDVESGFSARVLAVDDDANIRLTLERGLGRAKFECVSVGSAEQAAETLNVDEFDLVLLDIGLPGMSGKDLLPTLVARYPDTAVLMLTGEDDSSTAVWCMQEGAYDYVSKPVNMRELTVKMEKALSMRSAIRNGRANQRNLELMAHELDKRLKQRTQELKEVDELLESRKKEGVQVPEDQVKLRTVVATFCRELERLSTLAKTGAVGRKDRNA